MIRVGSLGVVAVLLMATACSSDAEAPDDVAGAGGAAAEGGLAGTTSGGGSGGSITVGGAPTDEADAGAAATETAGASGGGAAGLGGGENAGGGPITIQTGPFPFEPDYILGADITYVQQDEAGGSKYADEKGVRPIEQIMVDNGFNFIRMRTFVDPTAPGGYSRQGYGDTAHTIAWAKRMKACGLGVFLDFHMSDTWASIGKQYVPSAWAGLSPADMQKAAYEYVKDVMTKMVAAGVKPDMVQIGNETSTAMSGVSMSNWANFSGLVNAGTKAVRETDPKIFIWAQHGQPRPEKNFAAWSDKYLAGNPKIDVDGLCGSTYGTNNDGADWKESFGHVIDVYKKPVMSCEYTDEKRDLLNSVMRAFPNKSGRGSFLWEPTRYPGVNDHTLFTKSGNTYTANAAMAKYKALAQGWKLPVPSGVCK